MATDVHLHMLSSVRIASPCAMRWEDMTGTARTRHCAQCDLSVHDVSEMTEIEAELFLRSLIGKSRVCARLFKRADGTIMTKDCPVGLCAARERAGRIFARAIAAVGLVVTVSMLLVKGERNALERARISQLQPFRAVYERFHPPAPRMLMGDVCLPAPSAPQPAK